MEANSYYWQTNGTDNDHSGSAGTMQSNKYLQSSNQTATQEVSPDLQKTSENKQMSDNSHYTRQIENTNDANSSRNAESSMSMELVNPVTIEPKPRSYTCRICQMTFPNKSAVTVHSRLHTDHQGKPYRCSFCDKGFSTNFYLKQHERIHSGQKPYKCPMCELSFKQLSHVQQHVRTHTGVRPYKCHWPGCGKAFLQQSHLKSHEARHTPKTSTGEKPFKCHWPECGKSFGQLTNLKSHVARHTPGKGRSRRSNTQKKTAEEKPNNTPPSTTLSLQDVINQAAAAAEIVPVNEIPDEAEIRPYLCPGCSKVYVREATFKKHLEECKTKLQLSISATASALGIDPPPDDPMLNYKQTPMQMPSTSQEQKHMTKKEGGGSHVTFTTHATTVPSTESPPVKRKYTNVKEEPTLSISAPTVGISGTHVFTSNTYKQELVTHPPATVQSNPTTLLHFGNETITTMNVAPSPNTSNAQIRPPVSYILTHPQSETPTIESNVAMPSSGEELVNPVQPSSTEHSTINQAAIQWQWDQPVPRLNFP